MRGGGGGGRELCIAIALDTTYRYKRECNNVALVSQCVLSTGTTETDGQIYNVHALNTTFQYSILIARARAGFHPRYRTTPTSHQISTLAVRHKKEALELQVFKLQKQQSAPAVYFKPHLGSKPPASS